MASTAAGLWLAACVGSDPEGSVPVDAGRGADSATAPNPADGSAADAAVDPPGVPGVVNDVYRSGSRLQARYVTLPDQTTQFRTWFDTWLDAECTFRVQLDRTFVCVPNTERTRTIGLFADDTCAGTPAHSIEGGGCSRLPGYVSSEANSACFDDVFKSGAITTAYESNGAQPPACVQIAPGGTVFRRGDAIPPSDMVRARLEDWADAPPAPPEQHVRAQMLRGEDGSYGFGRWVLDEKDAECTFSTQPFDAATRCYPLPQQTAPTDRFADAACQQRLVADTHQYSALYPCTGQASVLAAEYHYVQNVCGGTTSGIDWYKVGAPFAGSSTYLLSGATCGQGPISSADAAYAGAQLPVEYFGAFPPSVPSAEPTIQPLYLTLPDGTRFRRGNFDGLHRTECSFRTAADGTLRCLPINNAVEQIETAFSDEACTVPLLVGHRELRIEIPSFCNGDPAPPECDAYACQPPAKSAFALLGSGICTFDRRARAFSVGDPAPPFWRKLGVAPCAPVTAGQYEAYDSVTEIDPNELFPGE